MERLCDALTTVGNDADPKLGMLAGHFVKSLRKNPPPDDQITATLTWLTDVLNGILTGEVAVEAPIEAEPFQPMPEPTDQELADGVEGLVRAAIA